MAIASSEPQIKTDSHTKTFTNHMSTTRYEPVLGGSGASDPTDWFERAQEQSGLMPRCPFLPPASLENTRAHRERLSRHFFDSNIVLCDLLCSLAKRVVKTFFCFWEIGRNYRMRAILLEKCMFVTCPIHHSPHHPEHSAR